MSPSPALTEKWVPMWPLAGSGLPVTKKLYDNILAANGSWDIQNLDQRYDALRLMGIIRSSDAGSLIAGSMTFNGDAAANYDWQQARMAGAGTPAGYEQIGSQSMKFGNCPGAAAPAGSYSVVVMDLPGYASTGLHKSCVQTWGARSTSASGGVEAAVGYGLWRSTAAINRISIFAQSGLFVAGSRLMIWGVGQEQPSFAGGSIPYGTSLPSSPVDGQEAILVDSLTAPTYQWRFRYNAQSTSSYKWEFVGGSPILAFKQGSDTYAVTSTMTTIPNSPSIVVPRAGRYKIRHGLQQQAGSCTAFINSFDLGVSGLVSLSTAWAAIAANTIFFHPNGAEQADLTAGQVLQQRVSSGQSNTWLFSSRSIELTPVRVS